MERLTKQFTDGTYYCEEVEDVGIKGVNAPTFVGKAINKLADYEDAEEQGLLLMLPCNVGDTIYRFWYVSDTPYRIQEQTIKTLSQVVAMIEDGVFGKTVFLTKEEAEQALADMQGV